MYDLYCMDDEAEAENGVEGVPVIQVQMTLAESGGGSRNLRFALPTSVSSPPTTNLSAGG